MPHVGRVWGLIAAWQQMKQEEELRLRRGDIWSSVPSVVEWGKAEALALLREAVETTRPIP